MQSLMHVMKGVVLLIGLGFVTSSRPAAQAPATAPTTGSPSKLARAVFADAQGRTIGEARLQETPHGVLLRLDLQQAPRGVHAIHFHSTGRCDGPTFESAGAHFAPVSQRHGFLKADGPHAGDLPNIEVPSSGQLTLEYLVRDVTLGTGPTTLFDGDGSALVIHEGKDDYLSDPAGDSGDRVACGRLVR
jgi:Cu-Zn family superoxide dismutase